MELGALNSVLWKENGLELNVCFKKRNIMVRATKDFPEVNGCKIVNF
jgi:hypothetical protein